MYLLDTDIIIYSLKGNKSVINNIQNHADSPKAISVITYGELVYGAEKSQQIATNSAKVHRLREIFPVIDLSCAIMDTFATIKAELSKSGNMVGDFDLLIAATAISIGYCVVSNNERHFQKIPGLNYENWAKD